MEPTIAASVGAAVAAVIGVLFVRVRRRAATSAESDSSDDETSGPLSVNVVADHDEQDSLLPSFAGLLRSPWHSVTAGAKEQPKRMRPVRKGSRSLSLPLRKTSRATEVPTKKVHVPYFFPLLDETAEWWQTHKADAAEPQTPEEEPETESESGAGQREVSTCHEVKPSPTAAKDLRQSERPTHLELAASPIEVGGN